jgi:acetyl-CoA carboxylase carboxyl transferase subunit alpha
MICDDFIEMHGDRTVKDDKAIVGGFASIGGQTVMIIGHQKGVNTKMRQYRNFGMANPEGYRKALRLMKLAEKFDMPIVTLIDTPGAFPGLEAEERGQGEAIARNIYEMIRLKVPVVCVVIGEGASGGALGIGVGDRLLMLEHSVYTVATPEACAAILWKDAKKSDKAAVALKITSKDLKELNIIDQIVPEPSRGAHADPIRAAANLKAAISENLEALSLLTPQQRRESRYQKFRNLGVFLEATA